MENIIFKKILLLSSSDLIGGANIMAYRYHTTLIKMGFRSTMVVADKLSDDPTVIELNGRVKQLYKNLLYGKYYFWGSYKLGKLIRKIYNSFYHILKIAGREIFFFPASKKILQLIDYSPDIIHIYSFYHNYFDIKILKKWHEEFKVVISLQDLWIFTGHCGLPLDCNRWLKSCGDCPHLEYYPSIPYDKTKENKLFKDKIFQKLNLNFISPSKWVNDEIRKLGKTLNCNGTHTIIKNSTDIDIYKPGNKIDIRNQLKLPLNDFIIMACAVGFKKNYYKDLITILDAFKIIKNKYNNDNCRNIYLLIVGEKSSNSSYYQQYYNMDNIILTGPVGNGLELAKYYQSADIFVHSSNIEPWGLTASEALSSGLPVISTNVGGLTEQILGYDNNKKSNLNKFSLKNANGIFFEKGDSETLSKSIDILFNNEEVYKSISHNARKYAEENLDINSRITEYVRYYSTLK